MKSIEFWNDPNGEVYYRENGQQVVRLTKFCRDVIADILDKIKNRFPQTYSRLSTKYQNVKNDKIVYEYRMVENFIRCNFGEHNLLTLDLEQDLMNMEEVNCPLRGRGWLCQDEGVICKPKGVAQLTRAERDAVSLYVNGYTCKAAAVMMGKNESTVRNQICSAKDKLGVRNCREIIRTMRLKNL